MSLFLYGTFVMFVLIACMLLNILLCVGIAHFFNKAFDTTLDTPFLISYSITGMMITAMVMYYF